MSTEWKTAAQRTLLGLRAAAGGWGYRQGGRPSTEPTALAGLGLLATSETTRESDTPACVRSAAAWIVSIQNQDGSLGLSAIQKTPCWATPAVLLFWNALNGFETQRQRAVAWLLNQQGRTSPAGSDPDHVLGHDATLVGWPWVTDTHSWLEPTAMAVLALCREGKHAHRRVGEGVRLITDRALPAGGWNYGNKSAFGSDLRPQPGPTGLALLALKAASGPSNVVENGLGYLLQILPATRAPASLSWGVLALRAWDRVPAESADWLADSYARVAGRPDAATRLALLLLAGADASLPLLLGHATGGRNG